MGFNDLDEFYDDTLRLPIGGSVYVVAAPSAKIGLFCVRLSEAARIQAEGGESELPTYLDDDAEESLYQKLLGPQYDAMMDAGVSLPRIAHAGQTAFVWVTQGAIAAEAYWNNSGKLPTPNRAARRSTSTAGASETRAPGSTNGTKSQPRKRTASPAKRTRSRGTTS